MGKKGKQEKWFVCEKWVSEVKLSGNNNYYIVLLVLLVLSWTHKNEKLENLA